MLLTVFCDLAQIQVVRRRLQHVSSDSIWLIVDFPDILCYRGRRRNRERMTAFNSSRSSQEGESSVTSSSVSSASESQNDCASQYSSGSSAESEQCRRKSDAPDTEHRERTENERLRRKVKSLKAELHVTLDCLEQTQYDAAKQKRLTDHRIGIVVSGLAGGQYIGYENGRVIHKWERKSDKQWWAMVTKK